MVCVKVKITIKIGVKDHVIPRWWQKDRTVLLVPFNVLVLLLDRFVIDVFFFEFSLVKDFQVSKIEEIRDRIENKTRMQVKINSARSKEVVDTSVVTHNH